MTTTSRPPRKPEWLRQQLSQLEQRQDMIRDYIHNMLSTQANYQLNGTTPPAHLLSAIARAKEDLAEVQEQLAVLETGWNALHPKT